MGKSYDFEETQRLVEDKYGPITITVGGEPVRFMHLLGMPKPRRAEVMALIDDAQSVKGTADVDADAPDAAEKAFAGTEEALELNLKLLELVCQTPAQWKKFRAAVGDNDGYYAWLAGEWMSSTAPGEAPASED